MPRISRHGFGQELESHRLIEGQVVGAIDLAHAAFAQQPDDLIPRRHHDTRGEASIARRDPRGNCRSPRFFVADAGVEGITAVSELSATGLPQARQKRLVSGISEAQDVQQAIRGYLLL